MSCLWLANTLLAGCASTPRAPAVAEQLTLTEVGFGALPGWHEDSLVDALPALRLSCTKPTVDPADVAALAHVANLAERRQNACQALARVPDGDGEAGRAFLEQWFRPYRAGSNPPTAGLFTGYYEPELRGARVPGGRYTVPLYSRPQDLVTVNLGEFDDKLRGKRITGHVVGHALAPYPTRAEIEAGALKGMATELLWVDDPIDAFFLQIQGSGRVVLEDHTIVRVGYAAENGRLYRSIGKMLVDRGIMPLEAVKLQSIKGWLRAHPNEAKALMDENAAYIFFRELSTGPVGAEGVELTPGRSLAVDPKFIPLGLPAWLAVTSPEPGKRIERLVITQDTGGAIKGAVRGDLFWGAGPAAEEMAGRMRSEGQIFLLVPREHAGEVAQPPMPASPSS
jgi:membrane-bound lytic murein transglycosylase A